jgi:hypothetical protein
MARRYGKGRAGARRRTRARGRAQAGAPKTAGRAKGRMSHDWRVGRVWK